MAKLLASSSNSSANNNSLYDVFINHRGPDTKLSIAGHLYSTLTPHGLRVFLDKEEMEKGDFLTSQIAAAIRIASVHIAIFSPGYANSEWCLDELLLMLESMESGRSTIIPVFYRVNPADLRWTLGKNGVYAEALRHLQEKKTTDSETHQEKPRYDSDAIEKWRNALSNVSYISGFDLEGEYNGVEWQLVKEVVQLVLQKVKKPLLDVSKYPTGLDQKVKDFEELLQLQSGGTTVIGIVGLGGVGKTTLAKEIFNRLRSNYKQSCFLFDIRESSLTSLQGDLLKDLSQLNVQIRSTDEGKGMLRRNLSSKQAIIILDNADHAQQLEALLLPAKDVLHSSSLIIITCRDKQLLINQDIKESSIYKLECLNQQHSQGLFCLHAFGQPQPVLGFEKVVEKFLGACHGLPLSLKVLGALLRGKEDLNHWEAQLRKISKILPDDIQSKLKISYDSLDEEEKQIFLDVACFFIGEDKDTAIRVWDGSDWEGWLGFLNLEHKFLVEVDSKNLIRMHDLLRDLGRGIGEKEPPHRFWRLTDKHLHDLPDKSTVRGINMTKTSVENRAELGNRFYCLRRLELVRAEGDCLDENIFRNVQSPHLIWLRWDSCRYSSFPPWIPMDSIRVLELNGNGRLETLGWEDDNFQAPLQLRELNIIDTSLSEIPKSIGKLKRLEKFVLRSVFHRFHLETLPHEFCHLQSLKHLELRGRSKSLPDFFGCLTNLQHINLTWCSELEMLPESFGELRNIRHINLSICSELERLSDSFGNLRNLQHIDLSLCSKLKRLPDSFGELKNLQHINLAGCSEIKRLPDSFGMLKKVQHIDLTRCSKIERLPDSFCNCKQLQHLDVSYCSELNIFPETFGKINTLECLNISGCPKMNVCPPQVAHNRLLLKLFLVDTNLEELPSDIGELRNLQVLHLGSEWLEMLPPSFGHLKGLQELVLSNCGRLKCLPDNISYLRSLHELVLSSCGQLKCLPDNIGDLTSLQKLELSGCIQLKCLPNSIRLLTQLRELKIKNSGVEYLSLCVMELNSLEQLEIEGCPLSELPFRKVEGGIVLNKPDASIVKCMLRLKYLQLFRIGISELSFSEGVCPNLQHLDIYRCGFLVEVGALPTTLINLELSDCCALRKIGGLCGLEKLEKFELLGCDKIEKLPGLETLMCLEELMVNSYNLKSIEGLAQLTRLQVLKVENCFELNEIPGLNVANCFELKEIPGLEYLKLWWKLNASGCGELQNGEGLAQLTELEGLSVTNYSDSEVPGLEHMKLSWELNADGCGKLQSKEWSALLTGLQVLNVTYCYELKELPVLEDSTTGGMEKFTAGRKVRSSWAQRGASNRTCTVRSSWGQRKASGRACSSKRAKLL